jgi:hypothetical protein
MGKRDEKNEGAKENSETQDRARLHAAFCP